MKIPLIVFLVGATSAFAAGHSGEVPPPAGPPAAASAEAEFGSLAREFKDAGVPTEKDLHSQAFVGVSASCFEQATDKDEKKIFSQSYAYFRFNKGRNPAWNGGDPEALGHFVSSAEELRDLRAMLLKSPWGLSSSSRFSVDVLPPKNLEELAKQGYGYSYSQSYAAGMIDQDEASQFLSVKRDAQGKLLIQFAVQTVGKDKSVRNKVIVFCKSGSERDAMNEREIKVRTSSSLSKLMPNYPETFPPDLWKFHLYRSLLQDLQGKDPKLEEIISRILGEVKKLEWFPAEQENQLRGGMERFGRAYLFLRDKYQDGIPEDKRRELSGALLATGSLTDGFISDSAEPTDTATPFSKQPDSQKLLDSLLTLRNAERLASRNPHFSKEERASFADFSSGTREAVEARAYQKAYGSAPYEILAHQFTRHAFDKISGKEPLNEWFYRNPKEIIYQCASSRDRSKDFFYYAISSPGENPQMLLLEDRNPITTRADYEQWVDVPAASKEFGEFARKLLPYLSQVSDTSPPRYTGTVPRPEADQAIAELWRRNQGLTGRILKLTPTLLAHEAGEPEVSSQARYRGGNTRVSVQLVQRPATGVNSAWTMKVEKGGGETVYCGVYSEEKEKKD